MKKINPRDVLTRHQVYLERLKAGYVQDYDKTIKEVDVAIQEVIKALDVNKMSEVTQKGLKQLQADLLEASLPIYERSLEKLTSDLQDLALHEALFEHGLVTNVAEVASLEVVVSKVRSKKAWERAVNKPLQATGELLKPFIENLSSRQISRVNREILTSVAQGRTLQQTVQAIRGTKARNFRDGVIQANARDARSIVRTATQHVSQQSREALWEANRDIIDRYQWVSTLDGRTTNQCKSLDQQIFVIGEGPVPPIHVGCRSTTVPYFKPSVWDRGATRSALFGPVGQSTSYYEWLGNQAESFQKDALGPTRAKLFREGGLSAEEFGKLQLDKNFKPLTLEEMRKLNPNAFEQAKL